MKGPAVIEERPDGTILYNGIELGGGGGGGGGPHTHPISDVTNLQTALDGKSVDGHTHIITDVSLLQTALNDKSDVGHGHSIGAVSGLQGELDAKSDTGHGHTIGDVSGLQTELNGKSATGHTHTITDVTNLQTTLNGKAATSHNHAIGDVLLLQEALDAKADVGALAGKSDIGHGHVISDVSGLSAALSGKSDTSHTHAGLPVMKRVPTADATNNSNVTFVNLFTQAVLAGEVWSFEGILYWFSAIGTTGLVTQVDAPASPTFTQCLMATAESATAYRNLPAAAGAVMTGTASAVGVIIPAYISGTIENGANAGNIVIKFRSEVNASLVTIKRGSWCRFYKH